MSSEISPRLGLDYVMGAQAQKHVTVNETFRKLDALVQLSVKSRAAVSEPDTPEEGNLYIVPDGASGSWWSLMAENSLAFFRDGEWTEMAPREGWLAWVADEGRQVIFDGAEWIEAGSSLSQLQQLAFLGVGTTADTTNPFAAKLNSALWTASTAAEGGNGDLRFTLNKETAGDTLSLLYQTGYSGRAEFGLAGDDDFRLKMSPDGSNWSAVLRARPDMVSVEAEHGLSVSAINGASLGARRNCVINGDFTIAQRGTEFLAPAAGDYLLDRWVLVFAGGMDIEVSQEGFSPGQGDIPGEPGFFLQWRLSGTASGNPWLEQRIEDIRCLPEGQASLSFFVRASRSVSLVSRVRRHFGAGGSATEVLAQNTISIATSWARFATTVSVPSLDGKTIGSGDHLSVEFYLLGGETDVDIDIADVQLEPGEVASLFSRRPARDVLQECQRYFAKTWPLDIAPETAVSSGALWSDTGGPSDTAVFAWRLPVEMRASPTVAIYSPATGAAGHIDANGTDLTASAISVSANAVAIQSVSHSGLDLAQAHLVADAEL